MTKVCMSEHDVYEILVREHEAMLNAFVLGLVRDPSLAEDVCQEAFVQGFRQLSTLKQKHLFPAWLRTIARNLALAELARRKLEVSVDPELLQGMEDVFSALDRNTSQSLWQERVAVIDGCLDSLPDSLRDCCRLHYFESYSAKAIAEALQISLAAALKRLERARSAIGTCVERKLALKEL